MSRIKYFLPIIFSLYLILLCPGMAINPIRAQESSPDDTEIEVPDIPETSGEAPVEETPSEDAQIIEEEIHKGVLRGAYWWVDPEPGSIAGFADFGIDTVAFRFGKIGVGRITDPDGYTGPYPVWESGGDFEALAGFPTSLDYRPVIETDPSVWRTIPGQTLADWLGGVAAHAFEEASIEVTGIELRLPHGFAPESEVLQEFLSGYRASDPPGPVVIGLNPSFFSELSPSEINALVPLLDGVVVYFMDYDYSGLSPRITDKAWIDATVSQLQALEIPFTAVLPIYNVVLVYPVADRTIILGSIDLEILSASGDARNMGAAGTEFTITEPIEIRGSIISPGDKVRVLESLREIDLEEVITGIPVMAPVCYEIDLFRFPLVPGFDPPANTAVTAAGWIAGPSGGSDPRTAEQAEMEEMDQKHNQTQQIIMVITIGMMMFILMRMFSKGAAKKGGEGGGEGGSK